MTESDHALSPLDEAHAHHLAGEEDAALRLALACAQAAPGEPGPIALVTRILVDAERSFIASEVAVRLVDAFVRRGDLPQAMVAAHIALDSGETIEPLLETIAAAFAAGSARVGDAVARPPPLPRPPPMPPALARLSGPALLDRAEEALTQFMASDDPIPADAELPKLPMFGSLEAGPLEQLLGAVRIDEVSGGSEVVPQGDEGGEAFVVARGLLRVLRRQGADETLLAQLGPGAIFGEMALVSAAPRSASVVAMEPTQLLVLARDELEMLAPSAPSLGKQLASFCRDRMESNLIRHARPLQGVEVGKRAELLRKFESRLFEAGETLITRGEEAESVYLIASGAVNVSVPEDDDRLVLATLGPGDVVGEISLVLRRPTNADVVAIHPTVTYALSREKLEGLMREYPSLLVELYDLATRREEETRAVADDGVMSAEDVILL